MSDHDVVLAAPPPPKSIRDVLLGTGRAVDAYRGFGGPFSDGFFLGHYTQLVELVDAAERTGRDPWPYVRDWALRMNDQLNQAMVTVVQAAQRTVEVTVLTSPERIEKAQDVLRVGDRVWYGDKLVTLASIVRHEGAAVLHYQAAPPAVTP